jgi:hypothetical protein
LEFFGLQGWILIFALVCFGGAAFVTFLLPETKGRSIEEIVQSLDKKN